MTYYIGNLSIANIIYLGENPINIYQYNNYHIYGYYIPQFIIENNIIDPKVKKSDFVKYLKKNLMFENICNNIREEYGSLSEQEIIDDLFNFINYFKNIYIYYADNITKPSKLNINWGCGDSVNGILCIKLWSRDNTIEKGIVIGVPCKYGVTTKQKKRLEKFIDIHKLRKVINMWNSSPCRITTIKSNIVEIEYENIH